MLEDDFATYALPSLPDMSGGAGTKITDATFNQDILRLTDASTAGGSNVVPAYSTLSVFNKDSTRVYVVNKTGSTPLFADVNPSAFACGSFATVSGIPSGLQGYWMQWSNTDADLIFGFNDQNLYSYRFSTTTWTLIKDFSGLLGTDQIRQMQIDANDNMFTWYRQTSGGSHNGAVCWDRSNPSSFNYTSSDATIDETRVDKTGRYLMLSNSSSSDASIVDLQNGNNRVVAGSYGWFHQDMGNGIAVHDGSSENTVWSVDLAGYMSANSTHTRLLNGKGSAYWPQGHNRSHVSMRADTDLWGTWSRYLDDGSSPTTWGDAEIIRVKTDGTDHIQRICHHRSDHTGGDIYDAQPHASSNASGTYIAFGSNWGSSGGRIDTYVVNAPALTGGGGGGGLDPVFFV